MTPHCHAAWGCLLVQIIVLLRRSGLVHIGYTLMGLMGPKLWFIAESQLRELRIKMQVL